MKIYTKTGDKGTTGLYGGARVSKSSPRIVSYGEVDELNACLGLVIAECPHELIQRALKDVQSHLFTIGAELASPNSSLKVEVITASQIDILERQIDAMTATLTPLKTFILPGGGKSSALLHFARTVCRRAERRIVQLISIEGEVVDKWVLIYMNRLSDFLFVMARVANQLEQIDDTPWVPHKKD